jgi:predicted Zn-dependent protease
MPRIMFKCFVRAAAVMITLAAGGVHAQAQGLIRDAEIEETLREWTDPILTVAGLQAADVQLFVIDDPSLNAFVANGQRIHIHTGLITAAETPGQIKAVIGHETCHIACGHSVSRQRAAGVAARPALVSIGLGILAIAAGEGGAGAALIGSAQQFAALNFFIHTRAEEAQADAAAVNYLSTLNESPAGLAEFFEKFRYQEVLSDSKQQPYFRAHPLAADRIRTARELTERSGKSAIPASGKSLLQFEMMKAKLIGFRETPTRVRRDYPATDLRAPARYARAISALRVSDVKVALGEVDALILAEPANPYFHELKGQILFESGRAAESVGSHTESLRLKPGQPLLLINLARSLNARGETGDVKAAETALRDALVADPENAFAWTELAISLDKQDQRAEAQLATAEAAYWVGDIVRANGFARRAVGELKPGTTAYRRADDILLITDPSNPDNRKIYQRSQRRPRLSVSGGE